MYLTILYSFSTLGLIGYNKKNSLYFYLSRSLSPLLPLWNPIWKFQLSEFFQSWDVVISSLVLLVSGSYKNFRLFLRYVFSQYEWQSTHYFVKL